MQIATLGRQGRLCGLDEFFEKFLLRDRIHKLQCRDMVCCASTSRQQIPARTRTSDDSAAGVQVLDDIHEPGHGLNERNRLGTKHCIAVP